MDIPHRTEIDALDTNLNQCYHPATLLLSDNHLWSDSDFQREAGQMITREEIRLRLACRPDLSKTDAYRTRVSVGRHGRAHAHPPTALDIRSQFIRRGICFSHSHPKVCTRRDMPEISFRVWCDHLSNASSMKFSKLRRSIKALDDGLWHPIIEVLHQGSQDRQTINRYIAMGRCYTSVPILDVVESVSFCVARLEYAWKITRFSLACIIYRLRSEREWGPGCMRHENFSVREHRSWLIRETTWRSQELQ